MILRSEKTIIIIKGLILLLGFLNNKYHPNTKNYLRCLLIGEGGFSIRGKGLVGGIQTPLNITSSSVGIMKFSIYGNIKNVPNHQSQNNV